MKQVFTFFFLSLFLLHPIFMQESTYGDNAVADNDIVEETCKICAQRSPLLNYDFCVTSLEAVPDSKTAAGFYGLGIISLELAQNNATDTISVIKEQLKNKDLDAYTFLCLKDCLELYTDAISTLAKSMEAIRSYNYVNLNIWVSSAMEAATTCEDGFKEADKISSLKKQSSYFFQLCDMALVITKLVSSLPDFFFCSKLRSLRLQSMILKFDVPRDEISN
ncbi:hypothetical protein MKW94_005450 [Papaver nudicaule]|uniref:Pectinesterase inhibitor domain-containing protein n=1 Tax=Papaver nudicaule TaxID=74823 RepID=A0AA41VNE6_PAPNU|nr:hypothetical protein [Papaver nudicaule]